ncbi:MAG TPA: hypothetical protein VM013_03280 [Dehalococcoidia bacterium]|nr:hypothetical protein [Dehalococcoidia bacterium]
MTFFKRLFGRKENPEPEAMHGSPLLQTEAEQQATRDHMLAEMEAARERLAAKEEPQGDEASEGQDAESSGHGS